MEKFMPSKVIKSCNECPKISAIHYDKFTVYVCKSLPMIKNSLREINTTKEIPANCPLEDYKPKEKEQ